MKAILPALGIALFAALAGCAHAPLPAPVATRAVDLDRGVVVSDDIRKICKIEDTERTPRFDFDSADLDGADRDVLTQVARCLTTGPLRGRGVQLIGRADPRGEAEYNMTLGRSRAGQVDKYLTTLGVNPVQLFATSRGELDATGTEEIGWRRDRRVDMRLVGAETVSVLVQGE
jgi:peptidoglycan-associated lipoprotein